MKAVVQRVSRAEVSVEATGYRAAIGKGLLVLLGIAEEDGGREARWMARKIANLRIFEDENGRMNLSVLQACSPPSALLVSQFTLLADCRKGNRPGFGGAAVPQKAASLYEQVAGLLQSEGITVKTGQFGAKMDVSLVNHGPVTLSLQSPPG